MHFAINQNSIIQLKRKDHKTKRHNKIIKKRLYLKKKWKHLEFSKIPILNRMYLQFNPLNTAQHHRIPLIVLKFTALILQDLLFT